jgi:hypothetical protein
MACTAITDIVVRESGRYLAEEIYKRNFATSPQVQLMPRGTFPKGMGDVLNVLTYERSAPLEAAPAWTDVLTVDGAEGGACLPPVTKIGIGSTTRNFNLQRRALEGPDFCAEDQRTPFALTQQLNAISDIMAEYAKLEWEIHNRQEYFRLVKRKVVVDGCPPTESNTSATTYPAVCPTSILTQGILDRYAAKLSRDGAAQSAMARDNGRPVFTLITSWETSENLIKLNPDLRQDIRWAEPNELLKPILTNNRVYRGFIHIIDPYPRRFTCAGGVYTEVPAFMTAAATKGQKADINTAYESAPYEETVIKDPMVMKQLIPEPITNPAPNFRFDPVTYTGHFTVKNIVDRICNPDGNILFHRGILAAASMPIHPERGVAFVHLRCDPSCALVTACS